MRLVHIEEPSIVVFLTDTFDMEGIWRVRRTYRPEPCMIRLRGMIATPHGRSAITEDGYYQADGLTCWRLLDWIIDQRHYASPMALRNAFDRLFAHNPTDALRTALRIYGGTWNDAPGEEAYFCAQQWRHHPREMSALASVGFLHREGVFGEGISDTQTDR